VGKSTCLIRLIMFAYSVENSLQHVVSFGFLRKGLTAVSTALQNVSFENEFYLVLSLLF